MLATTRSFAFFAAFSLACPAAVGCVASGDAVGVDETTGASMEPITDVDQSSVKRQSIGNCWLYATASWAESLHKSASQEEANLSESYWTYWHWFEQIANGSFLGKEISTGGSYRTAIDLIDRYGVMSEGDFIPDEGEDEMSLRQKSALSAINASLATGALSTAAARKDRALVRAELDRAWELGEDVVAQLDTVFGASVSKTIDKAHPNGMPADVSILRSKDLAARFIGPSDEEGQVGSLADAIGKKTSSWGSRTGALAWREVSYPWSATGRRDFQKRIQRALHDAQPVIVSWFVDFNALDDEGRFAEPPATPGRQGGHMTVLEDYAIDGVPGVGSLEAGELVTDDAVLAAALSSAATVRLFRVKNSWGTFRLDRDFVVPGYHDLYMEYLDGPVQKCAANADGSPKLDSCSSHVPLWSVVLPAGY